MTRKAFVSLLVSILLSACQTIPEWDKAMIDNPVEDGRCPDLSGRFNYEHLGTKETNAFDTILGNDLPEILPTDRPSPSVYGGAPYYSARIYNKIYKGKSGPYLGIVVVTLSRTDQVGRKYHVRVDWDLEGLVGEYASVFDESWVCSGGNLLRTANSTLHEDSDPVEIDPKDYRRIYVLPNGNIRIDRKHTFNYMMNKMRNQTELFRYYESRVFARIQK